MSLAVEHLLSIISTIAYIWPCYKRGGVALLVQGYFLTKYLKVLMANRNLFVVSFISCYKKLVLHFTGVHIDKLLSLESNGRSCASDNHSLCVEFPRLIHHIDSNGAMRSIPTVESSVVWRAGQGERQT